MLQFIVLALQIVLLAVSWVLFQQAKSELNAKAAEIPVLTEVQALHDKVKQLLAELERTAEKEAARLANECSRAEALIAAVHVAGSSGAARPAETAIVEQVSAERPSFQGSGTRVESNPTVPVYNREDGRSADSYSLDHAIVADNDQPLGNRSPSSAPSRRDAILQLAKQGESSANIARALNVSEGEVETVVSLLRP
jgi:DNA-binding NarL/FixJ family response regulator